MYVNEIEFEVMIMEKLIYLVFAEMVNRKIQQLEEAKLSKKDETDGNQWTNNELSEIYRDYFEALFDVLFCFKCFRN